MEQTVERTETAYEFLLRKGIRKVHQPNKRYNLTIAELVEFLNEFAENVAQDYHNQGYADNSFDYRYNISDTVF
jgi:hypothetical protein